MNLLGPILFGLHSVSWTCNFTSFVKFRKFLPTILFQYCSLLLLFQDSNDTNVNSFIMVSKVPEALFIFLNLLFSLLSTSDLSSSSWILFHSGVELFYYYYFGYCIFFSSKFSIRFFFRSSVSLQRLLFKFISDVFIIACQSIFMITTLKYLSDRWF